MVGFFVFYFRPTIIGFWNSFTDKDLLRPNSNFVGLENYEEMIGDDVFWNALLVTVKYVAINITLQTILAIGIAWILDRLSRSRVMRTVVLAPWLMSNVVEAMLILWILGFTNNLITSIGLPAQPFLSSQGWVDAMRATSALDSDGVFPDGLDYSAIGEPPTRSVFVSTPNPDAAGGLEQQALYEGPTVLAYDFGG